MRDVRHDVSRQLRLAPTRALSPARILGQKLTVSIDFSLTCQDTNHAEAAITQAWKSVRIRLVEGNTDMVLATLDTDRAGHLSTQVTIPVKASAGLALIRIDYADDVPLTIN